MRLFLRLYTPGKRFSIVAYSFACSRIQSYTYPTATFTPAGNNFVNSIEKLYICVIGWTCGSGHKHPKITTAAFGLLRV